MKVTIFGKDGNYQENWGVERVQGTPQLISLLFNDGEEVVKEVSGDWEVRQEEALSLELTEEQRLYVQTKAALALIDDEEEAISEVIKDLLTIYVNNRIKNLFTDAYLKALTVMAGAAVKGGNELIQKKDIKTKEDLRKALSASYKRKDAEFSSALEEALLKTLPE